MELVILPEIQRHRPTEEKKGEKFSPFSGHHATAKAVAAQVGVSYRTVQHATKFTDALEVLEQVSPEGDKGQW